MRLSKLCKPINRLCGWVCIRETALVELGIPDRAIRDSEPSSHFFWIDARRLRRHMRRAGVRK